MTSVEITLQNKVAVITMNMGENKLNLEMCNAMHAALDEIEKETDALTVVVKSGHHKIWSNGMDLDWIREREEAGDHESVKQFLIRDIELRRKLLLYPLITVAALNGHTFGGGFILSCCHDLRFMRSDLGYVCLPAIDLGYVFVPGTVAILKHVMPAHMFHEAMLTGKRFTGNEAAANHAVTAVYPDDCLMDRVMDFAGGLNKSRSIVGRMKRMLYSHIIKLMDEEDLPIARQGRFSV